MKTETKKLLSSSIKTSLKLSFSMAYWFVFGIFIFAGWAAEGAGLAAVLLILFLLGYFFIYKMTKFMLKAAKKQGGK